MAGDFDLRYWLELMMIKGVGDDAVRRLLRAFESPKAALRQPYNSLAQVLSPATARRIREGADKEKISAALKWAEADGNRIITLADGDYPRTLLDLSSPPTLLYAKGDSRLINNLSVAVVGSRSASIAGARNTEILARALSDNGVTIVSGLAEGIDAAAHRGGLAGASSTIAILGTGVDIVYPRKNRLLTAAIAEGGLLLSEFHLGMPPIGTNFPRRNRTISGLSLGCVVAEAAERSGALITADYALEQGREVFAVPGSINSRLYRGCHQLIKKGAKLVEDFHDILDELKPAHVKFASPLLDENSNANSSVNIESQEAESPPPSAADADGFLRFVDFNPADVESICDKSGLGVEVVLAKLLELEMDGRIAALPGGFYQRLE